MCFGEREPRLRNSLDHSLGRVDADTLVIETANDSAGVLKHWVQQRRRPTQGLLAAHGEGSAWHLTRISRARHF